MNITISDSTVRTLALLALVVLLFALPPREREAKREPVPFAQRSRQEKAA